jgi:hypothetical protein
MPDEVVPMMVAMRPAPAADGALDLALEIVRLQRHLREAVVAAIVAFELGRHRRLLQAGHHADIAVEHQAIEVAGRQA